MDKLKAAALLAIGSVVLAGCGGSAASDADTINVVGFSVLEQANKGVKEAFADTDAGDAEFRESYGASGEQARNVIGGQRADEVHLSLEPDVTKLVDEGLVAKDWKDNPTKGICTQSVVVIAVRKGNPKHIDSWEDLAKPGVDIVTPNPASSGSAKWNLLAAYGSVTGTGGSDKEARAYLAKLFGNVAAMPDSGRDATTAFNSGTGDVLLSYENEAILARRAGTELDYVVPDTTLLIQNPCALTKDAGKAARSWLDFQKSAEGQKAYAETGFRPLPNVADKVGDVDVPGTADPSDPFPKPKTLLTVDHDFGGWAKADSRFFDEKSGVLTTLQEKYVK